MRARSEIDQPAPLVNEPPAQSAVNIVQVRLFVDVVDEPVYLRVIGETRVNEFAVYSERTFSRLRPGQENHVKVLKNFVDVTGTSIFASTPRTPIVPFVLGSQPGIAIVNCQGALSVIDGGAVSLGASSIEPARIALTTATVAPAKNSNFNLMRPFLPSPKSKSKKEIPVYQSVLDLGTLEAKPGHQTLLIESESVDAAVQCVS